MIAQALRRLGRIDSAAILLNKMLHIASRNNFVDDKKLALNSLGVAYLEKGQYDKALKYFFESLELKEKDGNVQEISIALNNIGLVYYKLKDYDKALNYYQRVYHMRKTNRIPGQEVVLVNIGLCYAYKNESVKAKNFVDQGIHFCKKNCSEDFLANAQFSLGVIFFVEKNFSQAEIHFLNSYDLAKRVKNERFQLDNISYLLQIYIQQHDVFLAEKYLEKADQLIALGTPYNLELTKVYDQFSSLYKEIGDIKRMDHYRNKYLELRDKIYNEQLITNLMKIETEYLERENQTKIEAQNKILALNEEVILRQKYLNAFIAIVAFLLVALAIVLIRSNRQKQKINRLLDKKVRERTQELESNRDVLQRACEERDVLINKTANDIRNSIATLKGLCSLGSKDLDDPQALQYIQKMDATSDNFFNILNRLNKNRVLAQ